MEKKEWLDIKFGGDCGELQTDESLTPEEENPLELKEGEAISKDSINKIGKMLKQARNFVDAMQSVWDTTRKEFKLTDAQMKALFKYNHDHRAKVPENISDEEREKIDPSNGLDNITEGEIAEIFGTDHPLTTLPADISKSRVKEIYDDYFNYLSAVREYNGIDVAYRKLLEESEDLEMAKLAVIADNEQDPEKKAKLKESIEEYYKVKYLDFLSDPIDDKTKKQLIEAWGDDKKVEYWINRTRDRLNQLSINNKFILEISQFEKRFLQERYHKLSNMLLVYFMNRAVFSNVTDPVNPDRAKMFSMVTTLDNFVMGVLNEDIKSRVLNNIMNFLDQLIVDVYDEYYQGTPIIARVALEENKEEGE